MLVIFLATGLCLAFCFMFGIFVPLRLGDKISSSESHRLLLFVNIVRRWRIMVVLAGSKMTFVNWRDTLCIRSLNEGHFVHYKRFHRFRLICPKISKGFSYISRSESPGLSSIRLTFIKLNKHVITFHM